MAQGVSHLTDAQRVLLRQYLERGLDHSPTIDGAIRLRPPGDPIPLSYGQQQLWLLARLAPDTPVYNECVTVRFHGVLDTLALRRSLDEIIRRHEVWRTTFAMHGGSPIQVVHPARPILLLEHDLSYLQMTEAEPKALRLATQDAHEMFDLEHGPLLRARLVHLSETAHALFLTLHHIIFDGVSIYNVLLPELSSLYDAFSTGMPSPLPDIPIQYGDYAAWQRQRLLGSIASEQTAYWKSQLGGDLPLLNLPSDHPRPATQTFRGATQHIALSQDLTDALTDLGQREGVTLFVTLLAAFNLLLHRYTMQDDILIGSVTAGRNQPELETLMGFFLNTFVLRTQLSENLTIRELLGRVQEETLDALANQDLPFEAVVQAVQPARDPARNPLFDVMFTLEPPLAPLDSRWALSQMDVEAGTSKFDLSLELDHRDDGIIGRFEYNADLFEVTTIAAMVDHYRTILRAIVDDPSQTLSRVPLLSAAEHRQFVIEWNDVARRPRESGTVPELIESQAIVRPGRVAVSDARSTLTYRELDTLANQVANHLISIGIEPGTPIGVCMDRTVDLVVGLLGILKAGCAYLPLDPSFPRARIAVMLEDAAVPVTLTRQAMLSVLAEFHGRTICLDRDRESIASESDRSPSIPISDDDLAYLIYTSGSSGRPKGVEVTHAALANVLLAMTERVGVDERDVLLAVTTVSFDIAALELFLPLIWGGQTAIADRETTSDGILLAAALRDSQATLMQGTPTTWRLLLDANWSPRGAPRVPFKVLCGGEAMPRELARDLLQTGASIWNLYGPTEATIWATAHKVAAASGPIPVGRPLANMETYILDQHRQPVPIGVPGELYLGGVGLARGYANQPELTADKFIPHPFSAVPGARLYRTGDQARYLASGAIEWMERLDQQTKIRGYRIELEEIETVLCGHPLVQEAVVTIVEAASGDKRLVAYVVGTSDEDLSREDLVTHAKRALPAYMIPSMFVPLAKLPRTLNGKVDRKGLPAPDGSVSQSGRAYTPPSTILQAKFVQVWQELLKTEPIGIDDDFFDLGGHSLLAVRMVTDAEQMCGRTIPVSTLLTASTIKQLAALMENGDDTAPELPIVPIQTGGAKTAIFFVRSDFDSIFHCVKLARALGEDQPFYVLRHHGATTGASQPHPTHAGTRSLEEMAAARVRLLRSFQAQGPYLLGGYCFEGLVAFEMARQLTQAGQRVDLLFMISTTVALRRHRALYAFVNRFGEWRGLSLEIRIKLFTALFDFVGVDVFRPLSWIQSRLIRSREPVEPPWIDPTWVRTPADEPETRPASTQPNWPNELDRMRWVESGYRLRPYSGRLTLVWASAEPDLHREGNTRKWRRAARDTEVRIVPGTHVSILTEHIHILGQHLRSCLGRIEPPVSKQPAALSEAPSHGLAGSGNNQSLDGSDMVCDK